jgi:uncharacterized protein YdhG (YjbR/CyaY superfamily)
MTARDHSRKGAPEPASVFSKEERAAMREAVRERRARPRAGTADGEHDVREKIAAMQQSDRVMAERLHAIIKAHAPDLSPRTWYGMPAYSKGDRVVCFFRPAEKFKTRYATFGFSDEANLDDGHMWPTDFALTELNATEEARIVALLKQAVS